MPSLSLPIANRRVVETAPPVPQPEPAPQQPQPQQRHGFRAAVRGLFAPLLPIPAKTTRGVHLAPPEPEPELKSPTMSGGTTRRAASSTAAGSEMYLALPTAYSVSSGSSPALTPVVRTTRVQFAASPVSVKEYTPHDSQLSPWASPSALTPTGLHLIQEPSPPSSSGGSPSHVMAPLALFTAGGQEVRGAPGQQVLVPGNQVVGAARAPQVPTVFVGQPVLPAGAVQGQRTTITYLVPPAPASTVAMGQPTVQVAQQHPVRLASQRT